MTRIGDIEVIEAIKVIQNFHLGYNDCKQGLKHYEGHSIDYDRGYNTRYQEEQIAGAKS